MGQQSGAEPGGERLQKFLARAGLGSRRQCETLIVQGRVTVDGRLADQLGTRVDPQRQVIRVDGERVQAEPLVYYALNKPRGVVSTHRDPSGRVRVFDLLDSPQRLFSVGRLDKDSEGLMLLTNDGDLAQRLTHPRFGVPKSYLVQVAGLPSAEVLTKLRRGVYLSDGKVSADRIRRRRTQGRSTWLEVVLSEGRNREIRRMFARLGHKVMRLKRLAIGPVTAKGLRPGQYRKLTPRQVQGLRRLAATPGPGRPDRRRRPKRAR